MQDSCKKIMSSGYLTRQSSWDLMLKDTKALGMNGMEIFGQELFEENLEESSLLKMVRDSSKKLNLELSAHPWFDYTNMDISEAVGNFKKVLDICSYLKVKIINVHLCFFAKKNVGLKRVVKIIKPLFNKINRSNQKIVFENVPEYPDRPMLGSNTEEFKKFFDLVDHHPLIGFNLDVGHANINDNLTKYISEFKDLWCYTHINDNGGEVDEHLGPGMGTVDWHKFRSLLNSANYRGPLVIEFPEKFLSQSIKYL